MTLIRPLVLRETGENNKKFKEHPVQAGFDFSDAVEKPRKVRIAINIP